MLAAIQRQRRKSEFSLEGYKSLMAHLGGWWGKQESYDLDVDAIFTSCISFEKNKRIMDCHFVETSCTFASL